MLTTIRNGFRGYEIYVYLFIFYSIDNTNTGLFTLWRSVMLYALDIALKHDRTTVMTNYYYCLTMSHTSNN